MTPAKASLFTLALGLIILLISSCGAIKTRIARHILLNQRDTPLPSREQVMKDNVLDPPKSVRNNNTCEKFQYGIAQGYWINKSRSAKGILIYLHGGSYTIGIKEIQWKYIARMADKLQMSAMVINYSLAPEHPYPTALNEVLALIAALRSEGMLSTTAGWYLIGDSAGGGLALATAFSLRDKKEPLPNKMILISPWLDITLSNPGIELVKAQDVMNRPDQAIANGKSYAGTHDRTDPHLSPIFGNITGLPPVLIQTATEEMGIWDSRKLAQMYLDAHIPITYHEEPGVFHDYPIATTLPQAKEAQRQEVRFIQGL